MRMENANMETAKLIVSILAALLAASAARLPLEGVPLFSSSCSSFVTENELQHS